jgi:hypothetical protein
MHPREREALEDARALAPEVERILGVSGLEQQLQMFEQDEIAIDASADRRDVGLIVSIAGVLVSLVAYIHQVRAGQVLKGASREELVQELVKRVLDRADLPSDTKERLVALAIEKIMPEHQ